MGDGEKNDIAWPYGVIGRRNEAGGAILSLSLTAPRFVGPEKIIPNDEPRLRLR